MTKTETLQMEPERASETPRGFDAVADRYDADEGDNPALGEMRARSFARLCEAFPGGGRLVEVGSGTGTEAAGLAARGARLALVDVSPRLLERAQAKVRGVGEDRLLGAHLLAAHRVGELARTYGRGTFDGAYSSLGPLNGEPSLEPIAAGLAELIRPGGQVVLSVMNRLCAVEIAWFAAHWQWRAARRRWGGGPVLASTYPGGPRDVLTSYHSSREIERAFRPTFATELVEALPLLWPPTYLDFLVRRFPNLYGALAPVDRHLSRWPVLRDLGDHVLLRLRRRAR
jgi:SAM-dependent methyltransferase